MSDSPPTVYLEDLTDPDNAREAEQKELMDEETRDWPIEEKYRDALDLIRPTHKAVPLRVYHGQTFIEPTKVNDALRNSIVEIHFSLHHTFLSKQTPPRDSFRANIKQVLIREQGEDIDTGYNETDVRSGPVSAFTTLVKRPAASDAPSSSKPAKLAKALQTERTLEGKVMKKDEALASVKGKEKQLVDEYDDERSQKSDTLQLIDA